MSLRDALDLIMTWTIAAAGISLGCMAIYIMITNEREKHHD